jgi:3-dehydroquinate synthase
MIVPAGDYDIHIRPDFGGLSLALPPGPVIVVTESRVEPLWGAVLRQELQERVRHTVILPAGEANKTLETWRLCLDELLDAGLDRSTAVVALGGGVLGDLAGFAAATALRGVPLVACPTTLLSMVDSSVGGKTGVNHRGVKNRVGVFHPPSLVWAALSTLQTLPMPEWRCGWGEVVKTALVADEQLFVALEGELGARAAQRDPAATAELVARCVAAKAAIVARDPRDHGPRFVLNAGHTVGHGLEAVLGPEEIRHGEAVAMGLVAETRFAVDQGLCDLQLLIRLENVLQRLGLETKLPPVDGQRLLQAMGLDKKTGADKIRVPFPLRAGEAVLVELTRNQLAHLVPPLRTELR